MFDMDKQRRQELTQLFETFKREPFPQNSSDDRLSELFAELAECETYTAGLIVTVAAGSRVDLQMLQFDEDLKRRIETLSHDRDPSVAAEAAGYLRYLTQLQDLVAVARRCVQS